MAESLSPNGCNRPALTREMRDLIYPYLRAGPDERELGEAAFDGCASVDELSLFLAQRLRGLLG